MRVRVSEADVHYSGNLVAGAYTLKLFGDLATELAIRHDGDEGLLVAYESVHFLKPVYGGDFLEVTGEIVETGNTSRKIIFQAQKVIQSKDVGPFDSSAEYLDPPEVVVKAVGTIVVPKDKQRKRKR